MIVDIGTLRAHRRDERESLADLLGQVVDWRTELLDTVPFNGRRIQLLDQIIKNLETQPT